MTQKFLRNLDNLFPLWCILFELHLSWGPATLLEKVSNSEIREIFNNTYFEEHLRRDHPLVLTQNFQKN